jgi:ubiquitin-like modifier-activating enzyme ATG7
LSRAPSGSIELRGRFKNFNTIEEFRSTDTKKELFNEVVAEVCLEYSKKLIANGRKMLESFRTEPQLNPVVLVTFADLKKYIYHYWFAFPALVAKPAWEVDEPGLLPVDDEVGISCGTQRGLMRRLCRTYRRYDFWERN